MPFLGGNRGYRWLAIGVWSINDPQQHRVIRADSQAWNTPVITYRGSPSDASVHLESRPPLLRTQSPLKCPTFQQHHNGSQTPAWVSEETNPIEAYLPYSWTDWKRPLSSSFAGQGITSILPWWQVERKKGNGIKHWGQSPPSASVGRCKSFTRFVSYRLTAGHSPFQWRQRTRLNRGWSGNLLEMAAL